MKSFVFVGAGVGIPGLPHELTEDEAKQLGVEGLLRDAIRAGQFKEVKPKKTSKKDGD